MMVSKLLSTRKVYVSDASHVVQMIEDAYYAACTFENSLPRLDRYFLSVSALEKLKSLNGNGPVCMEIVTKAKNPVSHIKRLEGNIRQKSATIHLKELFTFHAEDFLDPLSIIRLYSYRFRIEYTFQELKQQLGTSCYHFWSKHMPKLSYYQKKGEPTPLNVCKKKNPRKSVGSC